MKYQKLISTNVKALRQKHNMTQEEFAEKISISLQGLSNIERNRYQPTAETVDKICKAFDITPIELLTTNSSANEDLIININSLIANCTKKQLEQIYDIILVLLRK